jgi:hypothetical protein
MSVILLLTLSLPVVGELRFSAIASNEELHIRFISRGCFSGRDNELTFRKSTMTTASVVAVRYGMERVPVGTIQLTDDEIRGLDRLLEHYRSKPEGWCSTKDLITFSLRRNGQVVETFKVIDRTCPSRDRSKTNIITLPDLIVRAEKATLILEVPRLAP